VRRPGQRGLFTAGALVAAAVTIVFATIGDGVSITTQGWAAPVLDYGHTAVWALLTAALGTAALTGRWTRTSGVLAAAALGMYALFLIAVLTHS
jgi:hypothetical protein